MNEIKLSDKNLKFDYGDLISYLDPEDNFTLRDVFNACINSRIPINVLSEMFQLDIAAFYKELNQKQDTCKNIEYLEITQYIDTSEGAGYCSDFHGVGKPGVFDDSIKEHIPENERSTYIEKYAIGLTPVYELADMPIKIKNEICIDRTFETSGDDDTSLYEKIGINNPDLRPKYKYTANYKLFDLLYTVLYEIGFYGSPAKRDGFNDELKKSADEIEAARANGTLDAVTRSINLDDFKTIIK